VILFCVLAFAQAWVVSLIVWQLGGLQAPQALWLIAVGVMGAPAVAHVLTRLITHEGWGAMRLRPLLSKGWPMWLLAWLGTAALVVGGMIVYYLIFPLNYDSALTMVRKQMPEWYSASPWLVAVVGAIQGLLLSPFVNGPATFGEEFGWRAYLLPKLMKLGSRRAIVWSGVIWGVWHAPLIVMGHNYGTAYPGAPWLGPLAMIWFCICVGAVLGWLAWRGGSVWPAVIGHATLNGLANLPVLFVRGTPNPLLGPTVVGVVGGATFAVVALLLWWRRQAWERPAEPEPSGAADHA